MTPDQEKKLLAVCHLAACAKGPHMREVDGKRQFVTTADIINEALEAFGSSLRMEMKAPLKRKRRGLSE